MRGMGICGWGFRRWKMEDRRWKRAEGWRGFPNGTALEVKAEGQKSGADTPQGDLLDRADKQCDLLVLGQTLTTDTGHMGHGGGSHALGKVHADVRSGIIDA